MPVSCCLGAWGCSVLADLFTRPWIGVTAILLGLVIVGLVITGVRVRIQRLLDDRERCILALMVSRARSSRNGEFYLDEILVEPLNSRLLEAMQRRLEWMEKRKFVEIAEIQIEVTAPGRHGSGKRLRYQFTKTGRNWLSRIKRLTPT
jgi:hypothetical protein